MKNFDIRSLFSLSKRTFLIGALLWALPCVLSVVLFYEYRYFQQQIVEFELLREDYNNYLLAMKKNFDVATEEEEATLPETGESKVVSSRDETEDEFVAVNRSTKYLRDSARSFVVAQHKPASFIEAVGSLYDTSFVQKNGTKKINVKRLRKRRRHHVVSYATLQREQALSEPISREPFFVLPINRGIFWLSSPFGPRKKNNGLWGFHHGIDMAATKGTAVHAAASGTVLEAGESGGYGKTVVLVHNKKFKTRYAHLDSILVKSGQTVKEGMAIGRVGATGNVRKRRGGDGSHLHFEVAAYGKPVNPFYYLR